MSLNQFNAIGRLTRDPETRAAGGSSVTGLAWHLIAAIKTSARNNGLTLRRLFGATHGAESQTLPQH